MSRNRHPDTRSLGNSTIAPYLPDEAPMERHERRKATNLQAQSEVQEWCDLNGWQLKITNEGHHWTAMKGNTAVEWWPSSAKLVKNKKWDEGVHCHDWQKLIKYLSRV